MAHAAGPSSVSEDVEGYAVDGVRPSAVVRPATLEELGRVMATAWKHGLAVAPWGGGTRMALGNPIKRLDVVVDLSRLCRVIQHNPADLTVTVEAGITLSRLQETLAEHGQFLALDPPLPHRATVGGTLATGVSGPLKWQSGHLRDTVIGMKVVQADGRTVKSGGQVVKNVSGYDMARLHIGGLGTLGIIAEVSFKLTPLPRREATLLAAFDDARCCLDTGLQVFHSDVAPLSLVAFNEGVGHVAGLEARPCALAIRLGGRPLTLERQVRECMALCRQAGATAIESLPEAQAADLWRRLADFGWDEAARPALACRAMVVPSRVRELVKAIAAGNGSDPRPAFVAYPGYGNVMLQWHYEAGEMSSEAAYETLSQARQVAHSLDGRLVIERCPPEVKARLDVWDEVGESLAIMRRLKEQYDARGILNPGRFVGGI